MTVSSTISKTVARLCTAFEVCQCLVLLVILEGLDSFRQSGGFGAVFSRAAATINKALAHLCSEFEVGLVAVIEGLDSVRQSGGFRAVFARAGATINKTLAELCSAFEVGFVAVIEGIESVIFRAVDPNSTSYLEAAEPFFPVTRRGGQGKCDEHEEGQKKEKEESAEGSNNGAGTKINVEKTEKTKNKFTAASLAKPLAQAASSIEGSSRPF